MEMNGRRANILIKIERNQIVNKVILVENRILHRSIYILFKIKF